jgi:hypothetical protein
MPWYKYCRIYLPVFLPLRSLVPELRVRGRNATYDEKCKKVIGISKNVYCQISHHRDSHPVVTILVPLNNSQG